MHLSLLCVTSLNINKMDDELLRILEGVDEDDEVVFEDTSDEEEDELEVSVCYLSIYIRCL